ncbi:hypothetical protein TorRG33x02_199670 [Trema orientale]|uniref:Secreted protein n=1 Tax=Trema orientale TaxID=63057 RepID=A0A2P5EF87_TREOI|nr:hypothetical protein TorRG33x02_199670 [Trema orientale]
MFKVKWVFRVWLNICGTSVTRSSVGLYVGESFHQTEPCPSITPFPLTVILSSFVKSIHCKIPEPQDAELVGAIILPSN